MTTLDIGIRLPLDVATRAIALVGNRGSGKTTASTVLAEQMFKAHVPVVILDPVGARWGIRSSADGKSAGLPFVLFGGEHSPDAPLYEESGETLADAVLEYGMSAVIDMSLLRKNAMRRFATDFLERLYQKSRASMHLVLEEAPVFAPQRVDHGAERLLGACEDIVLRGRGRGIGVTLIAQRAQSISKSVLSQCEVLFAMRQSHNLDKKAIRDWMDQQGDDHLEVIEKLAGLPTGEAFVWAPVLDLLERVKMRGRETFDSGATPKPGERRVEPKQRAEVDMVALKGKLAATIERAKADDPKLLRARIAELERATKTSVGAQRPEDAATIESLKEVLGLVRRATGTASAEILKAQQQFSEIVGLVEDIGKLIVVERTNLRRKEIISAAPLPALGQTALRRAQREEVRQTIIEPGVRAIAADRAENGGLDGGARRMLQAMASFHPKVLTRTQVATLSGISAKTGTFRTYVSQITTGGFAAKNGEFLELTKTGLDRFYDQQLVKLDRDELLRVWGGKLDGGARRMLEYLAKAHGWVTRRDLASDCGISETTGTFRTYISKLYANGLIEKNGDAVRISETFFL